VLLFVAIILDPQTKLGSLDVGSMIFLVLSNAMI
jgi:hypothetical protein